MIKVCARQECSTDFKTNDNRKKYCCQSCAAKVNNVLFPKRVKAEKPERKSSLQRWIDGEWNGTTKSGLSSTIRKFLLEEAEYRCTVKNCGWSGVNPVSGKSTLQVDHIDGKWYNNTRENLRVICPNCHSLTPSYGALNKGNGRTFRYSGDVA